MVDREHAERGEEEPDRDAHEQHLERLADEEDEANVEPLRARERRAVLARLALEPPRLERHADEQEGAAKEHEEADRAK